MVKPWVRVSGAGLLVCMFVGLLGLTWLTVSAQEQEQEKTPSDVFRKLEEKLGEKTPADVYKLLQELDQKIEKAPHIDPFTKEDLNKLVDAAHRKQSLDQTSFATAILGGGLTLLTLIGIFIRLGVRAGEIIVEVKEVKETLQHLTESFEKEKEHQRDDHKTIYDRLGKLESKQAVDDAFHGEKLVPSD